LGSLPHRRCHPVFKTTASECAGIVSWHRASFCRCHARFAHDPPKSAQPLSKGRLRSVTVTPAELSEVRFLLASGPWRNENIAPILFPSHPSFHSSAVQIEPGPTYPQLI
jgi:hypothetical protein